MNVARVLRRSPVAARLGAPVLGAPVLGAPVLGALALGAIALGALATSLESRYGTAIPVPGIEDAIIVAGAGLDDHARGALREQLRATTRGAETRIVAATRAEADGVLPGYLIDATGEPGRAGAARRLDALAARPGHVGLFVDPDAALLVRGRRGVVAGSGAVTVCLGAGGRRPARTDRVPAGGVIDLIALSRAAIARAGPPFPPATPDAPDVGPGTLFIGGGGRLPDALGRRFVEAAGGPDAIIVVIPTALGAPTARDGGRRDAQRFRRLGARDVRVIAARTPAEAETPETLAVLREAGGVWFSGGRQWRLVDAFLDTEAQRLMQAVLDRGGAIGGASAGASIQAEYMVRGHPLGNRVMMAEGYERGLGFLPGVAIDQHFTQRKRGPDMIGLKRVYPQLIGLGIDESTFAVVRGSVLEVVGAHRVLVYDRADTGHRALAPGDRYDLVERRPIE